MLDKPVAPPKSFNAMVVQTGARHSYALPRMINEAGCLHSFHTTLALRDNKLGMKAALKRLLPQSMRAKLDRRTVLAVPPQKTFASASADLERFLTARRTKSALQARLAQSAKLGERTLHRSLDGVDVAFIVDDSGGPELLRHLRAKGIPIAIDIVVTPMAHELTAKAASEWPAWTTRVYSPDERARYLRMYEDVIGLADLVMYPSEGVLEGLRHIKNFDESRSTLVPYALGGIDPLPPATERGRVLFAGSDALRKGLPYVAAAAKQLKAQGHDYEFVVAGGIPENIRQLDDCSELNFLGYVSRDEMARQMSRADVLCLPSLAEGMAGVTLEALASGVPCVVTKASGAPVYDGENGLIVQECDTDDLAAAIKRVVEDRALRQSLSDQALARSVEFTREAVKQKLIAALGSIAKSRSVL